MTSGHAWEWPIAAFALEHYAAMLALAALAYGLGATLTARCGYAWWLERLVFATAIGLGSLSYLVFALGLVGALSRPVLAAALAAALAASFPEWRRVFLAARRVRRAAPLRPALLLGIGVLGAVLLPFLLLPLYPPTHWDATLYHLALAKRYAEAGRLVFLPDVRFALFPQLNELLFALMLLLGDDVGAQLVQTLMTALLAAALWSWGRRAGSPAGGAWAAALLLANPIVIWLGSSAYIDIGVALFAALACYGYRNWQETGEPAWLALSGLCLGFAAACKYSALFWLGLLAALVVYRQLRRQAPAGAWGLLALGALAAAPWYVRNAYYSGNPIFPFFPQVFGVRYWTLEDIRAMLFDIGASYGVGRGVVNLAALPWHLAFNQDFFHSERHVTQAYLVLLPLVLAAAAFRPFVRWLCGVAAAYTVFWFYGSQELRYLLPALPPYSLAAGMALDWAAQRLAVPRGAAARRAAAAVIGLALLLPGWRYVATRVWAQGPVPVSAAERDAFLTRALPVYPAYRFLNAHKGRNYTVYAVYNENMAYFADGRFEGDWFGPARYSRVLSHTGSSRDLYTALRVLDADYLLISDWRRVSLPMDGFFYRHFAPVFTAGSAWLFELVPGRNRTVPGLESGAPRSQQGGAAPLRPRMSAAGGP